ncbi:MAG: FAD-binding protein [Sulfurimonadaceae bacterium]
MQFNKKLPVSYLLFTTRGRVDRLTFWTTQLFIWLAFYIAFCSIDFLIGYSYTILIYPLLFWGLICTATKRLHDSNKSGLFLLVTLVPILGPLWLLYQLGLKKGGVFTNRFGPVFGEKEDYYQNDDAEKIPHVKTDERFVNDVTGLNPIIVAQVIRPVNIEDLQEAVRTADRPISIGGGRFSMGGQTASRQSLHIDMRSLNNVVEFSKEKKSIKVQAGIRWCDIQQYIDAYDLSVKIMQTYANFTVGGSLSVNVHGRYIGQGPMILSVNSIDLVLADGSLIHATPHENSELFYGAIGGYNALGVIVQAELSLSDNIKIERVSKKMSRKDYYAYFFKEIRDEPASIFHNGDIYPPYYERMNAVTWVETDKQTNTKHRLMPLRDAYPLERYFLWAFSETPFGKWRREFIVDPIVFAGKKVRWKNYEAGYDVTELEPKSRKHSTYVLLEYFVPVKQFETFSSSMSEIFQRYDVNVINVSVRHAKADSGSYLAWAREEVFAFVVYYKQKTDKYAKTETAIWTRELIDAVISVNGAYYLPYQAHATPEQFHKAYPNANKLFELKRKVDPTFKFRNIIWDTYYQTKESTMTETSSIFKHVFSETRSSDDFYRFLQVIFHLYPQEKFHTLIKEACAEGKNDEEIYHLVQTRLPQIKPFLSELTYALPALKKQKKEITKQTLELLGEQKSVNGYLEIGSTGRYISDLQKYIELSGETYLLSDTAPDNSLGELFERGQIKKIGTYIDLNDYARISEEEIPSASLDLVTCYIGLHHAPLEKLDDFIASIKRVLKPGGKFILRDHDVTTANMDHFVSLVHTVFNLGLNESWEYNLEEFRNFQSIEMWCQHLAEFGFVDSRKRILQENDPSDNTLLLFTKG